MTQLKQAIAQYGPVSVLINTQPKSFKFYSSGIYYDPECSGKLVNRKRNGNEKIIYSFERAFEVTKSFSHLS